MKFIITIFLLLSTVVCSFSQAYKEWDSYTGEGLFKKLELPYGSLDQNGNQIYSGGVYTPTTIKQGVYEVELKKESSNDLFLIKGTEIYIKFRSSKPYSSSEGILDVGAYGRCEFYEKEN